MVEKRISVLLSYREIAFLTMTINVTRKTIKLVPGRFDIDEKLALNLLELNTITAFTEALENAQAESGESDLVHDNRAEKESSTTARESSKEGPGGFIRLAPEQEK